MRCIGMVLKRLRIIYGKVFFPLFIVIIIVNLYGKKSEKDSIPSLEKQVVTASRIPTTLENTNRTVTIIDHNEIMNSPAQTVTELLEYVPGVDIRQRGVSGVQADVHMRGGTFEQTLILVDGIKMSDAQTAHHNLDLPIALEDIERVEVLHGQGSRLFGPNAFGGVINIITKKEHGKKINTRLLGGEYGFADILASFSYPLGSSSHRATVNKSVSSGYRDGTEFDITSASYNANFRLDNTTQSIFVGYVDKPFGASGFYVSNSDEWEHTKTFCMFSSGDIGIKKLTLSHKIYWRKHKDSWVYDRYTSTDTSKHTNNSYGGELQAAIPSKLGKSVIGIIAGEERINSTSLGDHSRYNVGFVGEHQFMLKERLQIIPGILVYNYSRWGWQSFPGVDLGILIFDKMKFYGTFGRSFRVPSFTEYYMNHTEAKIYGDPNVKPSKALSFETGIKFMSEIFSGTISGYYREGKNIIDWLTDDFTRVQNVESRNINTKGIEIDLHFFPRQLNKTTPISKFSLQYTYINSDFDIIRGFTSKYLGNPLEHKFGVSLAYNYFKWFDHFWKMKIEKRLTQEGYFLLDTRLNIRFWESVLFFEVTNLFNTEYTDVASVPMPGRWFKGGLSISLSKSD